MATSWFLRKAGVLAFIFLSWFVGENASAANNAAFHAQSVPTSLVAGQVHTVSVEMKNTGTTTWPAGSAYRLGSQNPQDSLLWGVGRVFLSRSVAPGQFYNFSFDVTAPKTAGTYNFQWQMLEEAREWFGAKSANLAVAVVTPTPKNNASFVSQSVPATMRAGQSHPVSVTMTNIGNTTWTSAAGFRLGAQNPRDNNNWGMSRALLGSSVAPGQSYTFSFNVMAPAIAGQHKFQWMMLEEYKEWFGSLTPTVYVDVTSAPLTPPALGLNCSTFTPRETPNPASANCTLTNLGETALRSIRYSQIPGATITGPTGACAARATCGTVVVVTSTTPGTYSGTLVATPDAGTAASAPVSLTVTSRLHNNAQYIEQNVPTTMSAGTRYAVSVKMQNAGTTTWVPAAAYNLGAQNPADNATWGMGRVRVDTSVPPGQSYTFKFNVTAPAPGTYDFQWKMVEEYKEWFGASTPNLRIAVNPPHPNIVWTGVADAFNRGDKAAVLSYFADPAKYDAAFSAMGAQLKDLFPTLSGFDFIEIKPRYATAVVTQTDKVGRASQHYVSFVFKDGTWLIADF